MLMKITKLYFLMALALLSGGCKGWLTIDSSDRIMENTLFETEEGFFTALNGVYAELPQASLYGKSLAAVTFDVQAQYFDTTQPSTHTFNTLGAYSAEARKTAVADTWDKAYFVIANVNKILEHCESDRDVLSDRAYHIIRGEMLGIQLKDIDFKKRVIHIYKSVEHINNAPHMRDYTKTPAGIRKVPLLSMLAEALEPIRHLPPDTYIIGLDTKPITLKKYETMWQRFWRKYGVGEEVVHTKRVYRRGRSEVVKYSTWRVPVCSHQFRHEYVCMLAMAGVPEEIAIQLVGHANAKMIHEVYMALKPQMLEDARKRLDALL